MSDSINIPKILVEALDQGYHHINNLLISIEKRHYHDPSDERNPSKIRSRLKVWVLKSNVTNPATPPIDSQAVLVYGPKEKQDNSGNYRYHWFHQGKWQQDLQNFAQGYLTSQKTEEDNEKEAARKKAAKKRRDQKSILTGYA